MRYIISDIPNFCPGCGKELGFDDFAISDFQSGCCFICKCGVKYQKVSKNKLIEFMRQHSNSSQYWW